MNFFASLYKWIFLAADNYFCEEFWHLTVIFQAKIDAIVIMFQRQIWVGWKARSRRLQLEGSSGEQNADVWKIYCTRKNIEGSSGEQNADSRKMCNFPQLGKGRFKQSIWNNGTWVSSNVVETVSMTELTQNVYQVQCSQCIR